MPNGPAGRHGTSGAAAGVITFKRTPRLCQRRPGDPVVGDVRQASCPDTPGRQQRRERLRRTPGTPLLGPGVPGRTLGSLAD